MTIHYRTITMVVMMTERVVPIVSYAVQSKGPVPSGLMPDSGTALGAAYIYQNGDLPTVFDYNSVSTVEKISKIGKEAFINELIDFHEDFDRENDVRIRFTKLYANGFADNIRIHEELNKRNPDVMVVGVGPHVDWFKEKLLKYTGEAFDVLSYGDGDPSVVPLVKTAYGEENLENVPGIIYRKNGEIKETEGKNIRLDRLPFPLYEEEFYPSIKSKIMIPAREDGRGCIWSKCTYCAHPIISGKVYRPRPIEDLAQEINSSNWVASRLSSPDTPPKYINRLVPLIPGKKISAFGYSMSGYDFSDISGNMIGVFIGLESTDKHILENVLKKTRDYDRYIKEAEENIGGFRDAGVATVVAMMICPGETRKTLDNDIEFLAKTNPDFVVTLPMTPLNGTESYRMAKKDPDGTGLLLDDDFDRKFMFYDLDLLQRPEEWPEPPFKTKVNGKFVNPFVPTMEFAKEAMNMGMYPLSDEIVLMADRYHGGLSTKQDERRLQCAGFMGETRKEIEQDETSALRERVRIINMNQEV